MHDQLSLPVDSYCPYTTLGLPSLPRTCYGLIASGRIKPLSVWRAVRWYEFSNFRIHPSIVNFPSWYCRVTTYCLASPPAAATFHHSPSCSGLACAWFKIFQIC
jgi:hypothetical protein